ncbi:fumarylacetoacetase [Nisaea sediminum]|uniref:fumarylacetoacetase n=1 Tax=Nisaea sediminum TaxID=2775867 RepID=UPI001868014C|nr:fumarylacetoacetase [Nisaea sediminum]
MRSWLPSANAADTDFPVQNLPYGVFSHGSDAPRCGVAIGDRVLDLAALEADGLLPTGADPVFAASELNPFMERGPGVWAEVRARLTDLLREGGDGAVRQKEGRYLRPLSAVTLYLPFRVSEYTDFYAGKQHAFNVGTMFRGPENALPPNWLHIPIGYNGRASSVVVSGTDFHRPEGQLKRSDQGEPEFGPSRRLDIELEMGAVVGTGSRFGQPVSVAEADEMIFGYVLLNDWSARDIQAWEYQPLGPFQGKAFCTTISPWVVTKAALEPFRTPTPERERKLLPYLEEPGPLLYKIELEVALTPAGSDEETVISRTNYDTMYYSAAQQLAHHSSSGCPMRTGDLLGSGTISGETPDSYGSLLEMSWGGKTPIDLPGGVTRSFLEDGDRVTLRGHAEGKGYRIGFGDCTGKVLPART